MLLSARAAISSMRGLGQLVNSRQGQHSLQNRPQANEYDKQLEKACQPAVIGKFIDGPKTDRTDDDNNQNPDQN